MFWPLARKHGRRNYYISSGTFCQTFTQFKALLFSWILVLLNSNFALFCRFNPNEDKSGILNFSSNPKLIQTAGIPRYLPRKFSQWEKKWSKHLNIIPRKINKEMWRRPLYIPKCGSIRNKCYFRQYIWSFLDQILFLL